MTPLGISLACVFAQVFLTLYVIVRMGMLRMAAIKIKTVTLADIAVDTSAYPIEAQLWSNNVRNQFETPILFYALVAIGAATSTVNWGIAIASLGYVVTRILHHRIHVGQNRLGRRLMMFIYSLSFLALGWLALGVSLIGIV